MPSKMLSSGPIPKTIFTAKPDSASRSTSRLPTSASTLSSDKHSTSLPWILHHILHRQLSSELPLRIMFSFNAGEKLPTLQQAHQWWNYDTKGKLIIEFLASLPHNTPANDLAADNSQLVQSQNSDWGNVDHINAVNDPINQFLDVSKDPLFDIDCTGAIEPRGHSLLLIRRICLDRAFKANYEEAQFNQALPALDYLRDLECTRRAALREAATQLGIRKDNWRDALSQDQDAYQWIKKVQKQELEIESYYAHSFVDLRIWTMAHELQSEHFYKPNALAMLNTLFPPSTKDMPNDKIDVEALKKYRATFYQHILAVEAKGTGIVNDFVQQLLNPQAKHSWTSARQSLVAYIELADLMIQQANAVQKEEWYSTPHASAISVDISTFSERRSTVSSANTSLDGQVPSISGPNSPAIPTTNIITNPQIPSRTKTASKSSDAAITFQTYAQSPTFAPKSILSGGTSLKGNQLFNDQNRRTPAAYPTTFDSTIDESPSRSIPGLPGSKTDITPTQRRFPDLPLRNPDSYPSLQRKRSDSLVNPDTFRNKSHSIPSLKPLIHPRVGMSAQNQMISTSPLSSEFVPDEGGDLYSPPQPGTPNASSTELKSSPYNFLKRPYKEPSDPEQPTIKKKTSMPSLFRKREHDTTRPNPNEPTPSLHTVKSAQKIHPFPPYSEEGLMQFGKASKHISKFKKKSADTAIFNPDESATSLNTAKSPQQTYPFEKFEKDEKDYEIEVIQSRETSKHSSKSSKKNMDFKKVIDMIAPPSLSLETWTSTIKDGQRPVSGPDTYGGVSPLEVNLPRPSLKKNRSATAGIIGSIGKKWKTRKSSRGKADYLQEEHTGPYVMAVPDVAPHPPSAPSSPTGKLFASALNLPPRKSIRRTQSYEHRPVVRPRKASKPSTPKERETEWTLMNVTGFHNPATSHHPPKDHRNIPLARPITASSLAEPEPLPSTYMSPRSALPLSRKYNLTHHREYVRQALIEKAREEKYDTEFEKPRPAPMIPHVRERGREFRDQALWVPFKGPRAMEQRRRKMESKRRPPPQTPTLVA